MGKSSTNKQVLFHCLAAGNYLKIFKGPSSFKSQQTSFSGLSKNMWLFIQGLPAAKLKVVNQTAYSGLACCYYINSGNKSTAVNQTN
jgi:hypothetical protein